MSLFPQFQTHIPISLDIRSLKTTSFTRNVTQKMMLLLRWFRAVSKQQKMRGSKGESLSTTTTTTTTTTKTLHRKCHINTFHASESVTFIVSKSARNVIHSLYSRGLE